MAFKEIIKKINGKSYIYLDESYWDKEKKGSRHRSRLIGKLNENGEKVYRTEYLIEKGEFVHVVETKLVGEKKVAEKIIENSGVKKVLEETKEFDKNDIEKILALATYQMITGKPMAYADDWCENRSYKLPLSSQRISELLKKIDSKCIESFFKHWINFNNSKNDVVYDITSISSYNKNNSYVERGYNRDKENLEQINLGLVATYEDSIPLMYKILNGSISDVTTLENLMENLEDFIPNEYSITGDKGFYSDNNLKYLHGKERQFMFPVPCTVRWVKEEIIKVLPDIEIKGDVIQNNDDKSSVVYGCTKFIHKEEYGDFWLHIYYDITRKAEESANFNTRLDRVKKLYESGKRIQYESDKTFLETYFDLYEDNGVKKARMKIEEVKLFRERLSCCWAIITNLEATSSEALYFYRERNNIEVHFDNMKNVTDCKRLRVHNTDTMQGKLFIVFIALILINQFKKDLKQIPPDKIRNKTWKEIFKKCETYSATWFKESDKEVHSVATATQKDIFGALGIDYYWYGKEFNTNKK